MIKYQKFYWHFTSKSFNYEINIFNRYKTKGDKLRVNRVKELWNKDQVAIGGWLTIPSGISTEIITYP